MAEQHQRDAGRRSDDKTGDDKTAVKEEVEEIPVSSSSEFEMLPDVAAKEAPEKQPTAKAAAPVEEQKKQAAAVAPPCPAAAKRKIGEPAALLGIPYGNSRLFEQSLDVYAPSPDVPQDDMPLVVLVVGSGWLGHSSLIYSLTSWWNSAGPRAVARAGAVCVCVRHRGAFVRPPPTWLFSLVALGVALRYPLGEPFAAVVLGALAMCLLVWQHLARGAATFGMMMEDVCQALKWVRAHRDELGPTAPPATYSAWGRLPGRAGAEAEKPPLQSKVVFGGYSSGGHVAISLLHRPELLAKQSLPPPTELCDGVLLLSGLLGTSLSCPPAEAPRLAPRLTDAITRLVFGGAAAAELPSPVHEAGAEAGAAAASRSPPLPHVFIDCAHEVFGLPLIEKALGVYFCGREMHRRLRARGVTSTHLEVNSDHWRVLRSKPLVAALRKALTRAYN